MSTTLPATFKNFDVARYANQPVERLGEGVTSGYGIIGYKGKVWSNRYGGEDEIIMRPDKDGPANSIPVVIVKAARVVSRTFYEGGYVEGSTAPPDCMSSNGITPASNSPKPQAASCAVCPRNQTHIMSNGKPGRECSNGKRLAVVPAEDLRNEAYGGPMLLRTPGGSLTNLKMFGEMMSGYGFPYYWTYVTKIGFDAAAPHPKFIFEPVRPLTPAELDIVDELRGNPNTDRIVDEVSEGQNAGNGGVPWTATSQSANHAAEGKQLTHTTGFVQVHQPAFQSTTTVDTDIDLDAELDRLMPGA